MRVAVREYAGLSFGHFNFNRKRKQTAVTNIFILYLTFRMCCNIRNVKYKMKMFVTAVCFLFMQGLLKLFWLLCLIDLYC